MEVLGLIFCGETKLNVKYNNSTKLHTFLVVDCKEVNLFGRDLCKLFNVQISLPNSDIRIHNTKQILLEKHTDYLADNYEPCVEETVSLNVLPNSRPIFSKARSVPVRMKDKVKEELDRLVQLGKITKIFRSDWASPAVNVMKKDGSVRICGDYSATVNKFLDPVPYPLPTIDDAIARMDNAKIFSKIDLSNAFLQLPLDEDSKKFTTINTCEGLFQYNFLSFGLTASSGIFQSFMCKTLNGINNVIIYQDDILVFSSSIEEHNITLDTVLTTLKETGIKLNTSKCAFLVDKVDYLGYVFDTDGVHPNPEKVRAIIDAPSPINIKQLQAFVGLCNFYSRFIRNFSTTLAPLYNLLKKSSKFIWGPDQEKSFTTIKKLFLNNDVLKMFDSHHETMLETDSSGYGTAAVLMQRENSCSPWMPVQFSSRTLNNAEKNYSNIEREALSVIFGIEKFSKFLLGSKFIIRNDQQPLKKLLSHESSVPTTCSARLQRWKLKLSQFNYTFEYSKGKDNVNSDCLSRLPLTETKHKCEPYELIFALQSLNQIPITCNDIKQHTNMDPNLVQLKHFIKYGWPTSSVNSNLAKFKNIVHEMTILDNCIIYKNRVFIPETLRKLVLNQIHEGHPGICAMKSIARSLIWYPQIDEDITALVKSCNSCQINQSKPPQNNNVEWPVPGRAWSRVHIDHFFLDGQVCLVAIDALSKYIECEIVKNTSVQETIEALRIIFSRNGLCDVIVSDNASCFTAEQFKEFLHNNAIDHITPPPYSPSSNGQAERSVKVIKDLMRKNNSSFSFKTRLAETLLYYRSVPHSVTNVSPSVALNNRKFITVKDRVHPYYCQKNRSKTSHKKLPNHEVGDKVLALNLRDGPKWLHGSIVEKLGVNVFNVLIHDYNIVWKRHSNQLLSCHNENKNESVPDNAILDRSLLDINLPINIEPNNQTYETVADANHASSPSSSNLPIAESNVTLRRSERIRQPVIRYGID